MDRWRARKERKAADEAERLYWVSLNEWQDQRDHVEQLIYIGENLEEVQEQATSGGVNIRLKKGENVLAIVEQGGLVEPRVTGSHYEGGSQGMSIRVMKGVSYRVGQHKGTFVRGDEEQTIVDTGGEIYITDQRVQYSSMNRNREWAWSKLVDIRHSSDATYMGVTNRQKPQGSSMALVPPSQFRIASHSLWQSTTARSIILCPNSKSSWMSWREPSLNRRLQSSCRDMFPAKVRYSGPR